MSNKRNQTAMTRRQFLAAAGVMAAAGSLPGISWASTAGAGNNRLVVIILRGAMDGLSAVVPYGDSVLAEYRQALIPPTSELLTLDNYFALHPALTGLFKLHQSRELAIVHAVATAYRERSHFDGQNVLESGLVSPQTNPSGWLNRAIQTQNQVAAMALGQSVPLILRGSASVGSWTPPVLPAVNADTLNRLLGLYNNDAFLGPRLVEAIQARDIASSNMTENNPDSGFSGLMSAAANFLTAPAGPNIVVLENDGWDTHANQGAAQGTLQRKLTELDTSISQLKTSLGPVWQNTMVVVMTEFGRTVRVNGTAGTDHGTASACFLAGGALGKGSSRPAVLGAWPGLQEGSLRDGRDLQATTDLRSLLGEILYAHMGFSAQAVRDVIFPESPALGFRLF